jgi:hypothetical protein
VRVRTSEGREGRFIVWWRGRKGRGEERDITAMETLGNGNRTYCKGLVYESVESQSGTTRRHGIRQGPEKGIIIVVKKKKCF